MRIPDKALNLLLNASISKSMLSLYTMAEPSPLMMGATQRLVRKLPMRLLILRNTQRSLVARILPAMHHLWGICRPRARLVHGVC